MHASDDHKGVGRIPVRAGKKSGQGRTDKQNGQWGIQVLIAYLYSLWPIIIIYYIYTVYIMP